MNYWNHSSESNSKRDLGSFAWELLVEIWADYRLMPWVRTYFKAVKENWWFSVDNVNRLRNAAGANIYYLLGKHNPHLVSSLDNVEWVERSPVEAFLWKLSGSFRWSKGTIAEYEKTIRFSGNPNAYPISIGKPLLHFLCGQFFSEHLQNRYITLPLIEELLQLQDIDPNMLDIQQMHIFDIFDDYDSLTSDKGQILKKLLENYWTDWDNSTRWMISTAGYIVPRQEEGTDVDPGIQEENISNEDIWVWSADPYLDVYQGHPNKIGNMIDEVH